MKNSIKLRGTPDESQQSALGTIQTWGDMDLGTQVYSAAQVETRIGDINTSVSQYIADHVSAAYKYKGSVATFDLLPSTDLTTGDVYNVVAAFEIDEVPYPAGTDVAWTGTAWNALGGRTLDDSGKADKVANATSGNFAGLDQYGNLTDSGSKAVDFATAAQGAKADTAVQSVALASGTNNGTVKLTVDGVNTDNIAVKGLGSAAYTDSTAYATAAQGAKADTALQQTDVVSTYSSSGTAPVNGTAIAAAISGLNSEETSSDGTNVQVRVEMVGGAIANVNVITDETAARDHEHYAAEIKDLSEVLSDYASNDHTHVLDDITDAGNAAALNVGTSSGTVAAGDHTHGNITTDGKIGSTADLAVVTTTDGAITTANLTTAAPTTGSTATVEFIASVSQDSKGKITATKEAVRAASASASGLMSASDFTKLAGFGDASTYKTKQTAVEDAAVLGKYVSQVEQNANGEITVTRADLPTQVKPDWNAAEGTAAEILNKPMMDGTYNASTNKVATQSTVTDAIATLDVTEVSVGASKTVDKISETDGKISVTTTDIQIAESQVTNLTTDLNSKASAADVTTIKNAAYAALGSLDAITKETGSSTVVKMDTANEIKAVVQALYTLLHTFVDAFDAAPSA